MCKVLEVFLIVISIFDLLKKMRRVLIHILIIGFVVTSCSKKEGCSDPMAINHDASADKANNNLCSYTTATFYASSNTFTGAEVTEIILTIGQADDTIGVIQSFNQPYPTDCFAPGTLQYEFKSGNSQVWFAQYRLAAGGVVTAQGDFEPSSTIDCLRIDILP